MAAARLAAAALRALGWALLSLAALAGVALSAVVLYARSPAGRPVVAGALVRLADDALAGRFELEGIAVLPQGGVEVVGLRVFDPEERLVLAVDRARVFADVTRLGARELGLVVELDGPAVLLEEDPDGGLSLARAFAPSSPSVRGPEEPSGDGGPLTLRVSRLEVQDGEVWWVDRAGETRLEASELEIDARALWSSDHASAEVTLRGEVAEPLEGAVALDGAISREGATLSAPLLSVRFGDTAIELAGHADLEARTGRAVVRRFEVARGDARALAPAAGAGADLEGAAYAEADGRVASLAIAFAPRDAGSPGRGELAAALALDGPLAVGLDVALDRVDPARLHAAAPPGEVTLAARGAAQGTTLEALHGRLELSLAPSRLRQGRLGPASISARAHGGTIRVDRLALDAPGLALSGAGTWRRAGAVSGKVTAEASDVGAALRNAGALLGEPLPAGAGRLRVDAALSGTSARPELTAGVESDALRAFDTAVRALRLDVDLVGPLREGSARVRGRVGALAVGGSELARGITLEGDVAQDDVRLDLTAAVPSLGDEVVALELRGTFGPRRETLRVAALALAYPGQRFTLAAPATVRLAGPSVDRLELASGAQRLSLEGGLGARGALAARLRADAVDLARLPHALAPPELAGEVWLDATARGTPSRPELEARVRLARGSFRGLAGLAAEGELRLDGAARRIAVAAAVARAEGGAVELSLEAPWPLEGRDGPLGVRLAARELPVEELLAAAEVDVPAAGLLSADLRVEGTLGAPRLRAELGLADGVYDDLAPIAARLGLIADGERLGVELAVELDGNPALALEAGWPLLLARVLHEPAVELAALRTAPLQGEVRVPGLRLESVAGALGLPDELAGRLELEATVAGTLAAPRGKLRLALAEGAVAGYRGMDADVAGELGAAAVSAAGAVAVGGAELISFRASLGAAPEALLHGAALRAAPLELDLVVPEGTLARAAGEALPLTGTLRGALRARGSLADPVVEAAFDGADVRVQGRPLGAAVAEARYAGGRTDARAELRGAGGGTAHLSARLDAAFGLGADLEGLGERPVEARLVAEQLDLGVLAALAPGLVRSAVGRLDADLVARGPLARPSPRGTATAALSRLAVSEYGEWTDVALDAAITDDAVELRTLRARRGSGRVDASGSLRGLASGTAQLEGRAKAEALTITRAGMPIATFDLETTARGAYAGGLLEVELRVPRGVIRLPDRLPRELQEVEPRADIAVGRPKEPRRKARVAAAGAAGAPDAAKPLALKIRGVVNDQLFVRSNTPRVDLELKGDVTYGLAGGESYAEGSVDVIRGSVEMMGRAFDVQRGHLQFTGGPPTAALLDVQALYDNPVAEVTVVVAGPLLEPDIRLTSVPPMDEAQIAMLIATGRTDLKAGAGGVETITGEEAGRAAVSALATQVFRDVVADKLPLDTVAIVSGSLRAGKYVGDKIYVGYTRRFEADPERDENIDEVRVEYRISRRWTFESRYGSAQSGGASLVWSRDY